MGSEEEIVCVGLLGFFVKIRFVADGFTVGGERVSTVISLPLPFFVAVLAGKYPITSRAGCCKAAVGQRMRPARQFYVHRPTPV